MPDYVRGVKAGLIAGIGAEVVFAVGTVSLHLPPLWVGPIVVHENPYISYTQPALLLLLGLIAGVLADGFIIGAIAGLIFALVQGRVMKNTSLEVKGLLFGSILWVLDDLLGWIGDLDLGLERNSVGTNAYGAAIAFGLGGYLTLGYLLGSFFRRFGPQTAPPPAAPAGS